MASMNNVGEFLGITLEGGLVGMMETWVYTKDL